MIFDDFDRVHWFLFFLVLLLLYCARWWQKRYLSLADEVHNLTGEVVVYMKHRCDYCGKEFVYKKGDRFVLCPHCNPVRKLK